MALLHLMEPNSVILPNKERFRPTIQSAKERLFKVVEGVEQIDAYWEFFKKDRRNKQLNLYPIIFGIGADNASASEFVLKYNDVSYFFGTFLEALDASFKFCIFFKITFSPEHKRFWVLLNGLFYKINMQCLNETPAISSCVKSFQI